MKIKVISILLLLFTVSAQAVQGDFTSEQIPKVQMNQILPLLTKVEGTVPAQWRVVWSGDPSTEAKISWTTAEAGSEHMVYFGTKPAKGNLKAYTKKQKADKNGQYQGKEGHEKDPQEEWAYYHHVNLKGLKPGTRYYFTIKSDNETSREFYFITAPKNVEDYYFLNGGDSRTGHLVRCKMNLRMTQMMEDNPKIIALTHSGDYCHQGGWWSHFRLWLSHNELLTASDGRILPIVPTRGNHEPSLLYADVFDTEYFYTTKFPLNTNIITLDSNGSRGITEESPYWPEKSQGEWFNKEIAKVGPKSRWLIMQYHAPIYPAVKGRNKTVGAWEQLFDQYKVDLAMEADGHVIKVSKPIRNKEFGHPEGTYYIGEGGLGAKQRGPKKRPYLDKVGRGAHVFLIHVTKKNMNLKCVLMDNSVWHEFDIKPKSHKGE